MIKKKSLRTFFQQGFSLIEVLIAMFVIAIGLLGAAGLQLQGLQQLQSSYLRSQATIIAYDMADRMRANPVALASGAYNDPTAKLTANCLTIAGCTPAELAEHDFYEWTGNGATSDSISNILPLGLGVVCLDSSPDDGTLANPACDNIGSLYAIKVWWSDDRSEENFNNRILRFVTTVSF